MKILLVYASAGAGHLKAAGSLFNYLRKTDPSLEVESIDILKYCHPLFSAIYVKGYNFCVRYAPWVWAFIFYSTQTKFFGSLIRKFYAPLNRFFAKKFLIKAQEASWEIFIFTHFLPAELISGLKKNGKLKSRLISVITDFGAHPFWISENIDLYAVACDSTRQQLLRHGVAKEKIAVTGIPVDPQYCRVKSANGLLEKSGLKNGRFTVCLVTGSFGTGPIEKIVESLRGETQILVVTAHNKKLYERLSAKSYSGVKVFGFIDNMQEVIAACDIVLTKPGGMTIAELLVMEKPFIFITAIPGQEQENMRILREYGVGNFSLSPEEIKKTVILYKTDTSCINRIKDKMREISKPFAGQKIYELIR